MKIKITMEVIEGFVDRFDKSGITDEGYQRLVVALAPYGDDIEIRWID